ncbi:hypothetical protein, partial [Intestinibacter sp.]|uniref:hypothetical protein n=1 Tax=Intestinibacter sp. TaxID=1965304 RepID=UPI002A75538F
KYKIRFHNRLVLENGINIVPKNKITSTAKTIIGFPFALESNSEIAVSKNEIRKIIKRFIPQISITIMKF